MTAVVGVRHQRARGRPGLLGAPFLTGAAMLVLAPTIASLALALTESDGFSSPRFVGLATVAEVTGDPRFARAAVASVGFALVSVVARMAAVTGLVLLLAARGTAAAVARALVFVPSVVPDTALALVWLWLLDPLRGPVAALAGAAGFESVPLLVEAGPASLTVPLVAATRLGEAFVVALAARRALPPWLLEVAAVEGASAVHTARRVVLPLLAPVLGLLALRDVIASLGGGLGAALVLTGGGPAGATTYLPQYAREEGFAVLRFGTAAAVGALTLVASLAVAAIAGPPLIRTLRRVW